MILHYANAFPANKYSAVVLCSHTGELILRFLQLLCYKITRVNYLLNIVQGVTKRDDVLKILH